MFGLLRHFLPSDYVKSIFDIQPKLLLEKGIKGIITDLDNTLVAWDVKVATEDVIDWFEMIQDAGIKITIISNNNEQRVKKFSEPLNIPFIASAKKPFKKSFKRAAKQMGIAKNEVAVIGDQLLTDVFGGNRAGLHTILVAPIVQTDAKITTFNRKIERKILNHFRKKGKITWEE